MKKSTTTRATVGERAADHALAANPLIGIRRKEVARTAATLASHLARQPGVVGREYARLARDLVHVAGGRARLAPAAGDRRFADAAWSGNAGYRRLLQAYLVLGAAVDRCVSDAGMSARDTERAKFVASLVVDALAPTNALASNPAALRKLVDSKGASLLRGFANLIDDVASGRGLPKQVDGRTYAVGRNVGGSRGAVVFRNDLVEVIQYTPTTAKVHARPLLIVPPQINKFYVFDLTPPTSIVAAAVAQGIQTFCVSFRNPTRANAAWDLDAYVRALDEAARAVRDIAGTPDINVMGACSGGITLVAWLGYLAAKRARLVHAATLVVCVIDTVTFRDSIAGLFVTPRTIAAAKAASRKRGVVEGTDLARTFAWMRPNDLVWNYVVNNYLLGTDPPASEILFWNNDTTRLPAALHADFLDLFSTNALAKPRALTVCGRTVDLGKLDVDTYVVGGMTDHITPWQGVYRTAQLVGGRRATFVLSNGGHIQSLVNPPGNKRSWFMTGPTRSADGERWSAKLAKNEGSWWPHWHAWLRARSGATKAAPQAPGSTKHPALDPAPGTYVVQ
jgi:poly[(R)-3-hydroxyalkanoate] polymerase subunit PhaC